MEYTIAAIPTMYNGRQYRSRLEARWAAFFDQMGWAHEYEPYDLGEWSPDFLIRALECDILVEVKPITDIDPETCDRMIRAVSRRNFAPPYVGVLLVGTAPIVLDVTEDCCAARLGFAALQVGDGYASWREFYKAWFPVGDEPNLTSAFAGRSAFRRGNIHAFVDFTMKAWASACNTIQYIAKTSG